MVLIPPDHIDFFQLLWKPCDTIIIAAGDDEMPPSEIFSWVQPLLSGIPRDKHSTCTFDLSADGVATARFQDNHSSREHMLQTSWTPEESEAFAKLIPHTSGLAVMMLGEHTSQVFTLVDSVAHWLSIYDTKQIGLKPLLKIFSAYGVIAID